MSTKPSASFHTLKPANRAAFTAPVSKGGGRAVPYPAFLDLQGRPAVVVGGGDAAAGSVRSLLRAGAAVTVVAPRLGPALAALVGGNRVHHIARGFVAGDVRGQALAHGATGIEAVDARVFEAAAAAGVPVNVAGRPDLSTFEVPAVIDRAPVVVALSDGGGVPALGQWLRAEIDRFLPARLDRLARFVESFRSAVRSTRPGEAGRRFWARVFTGPIAAAVLAGEESQARERMVALVNASEAELAPGRVAIVGAGPGDPELLTVRALGLIRTADVIVYDRLVGPDILALARSDAGRIFAGKAKGAHSLNQEEINELLVEQAAAGRLVVRLKGGDPFVFGRGGEELDHLRRHGVAVELVPGITAATGCAATAGIPLTHRAFASAVTLVTGHGRDGEPALDWSALARGGQTLVIYMGLATAGHTARRLIERGLDPATPAAVIENGTRADQRIAIGTVGGLETLIETHAIMAPALIVIGEVAALADTARVLADTAVSQAIAV